MVKLSTKQYFYFLSNSDIMKGGIGDVVASYAHVNNMRAHRLVQFFLCADARAFKFLFSNELSISSCSSPTSHDRSNIDMYHS